jgi:hypothetical protein
MKDIYSYIPETNHVYRVYNVAAVLYLQFVLHVMLFRVLNISCTFTSALSAVCVLCPIWLFFCSSLISRSPGTLLRCCVSDFEIIPVAPITIITIRIMQLYILHFLLSGECPYASSLRSSFFAVNVRMLHHYVVPSCLNSTRIS